MDGDDGAERSPGFRDLDKACDVGDEIVLAPEQPDVGDPVNDVGRTSAFPIELCCHWQDAGRGEVPRLALNILLMLVQGKVHASSIEQVRWVRWVRQVRWVRKSSTGRRSHAAGASGRLKAKSQLRSCQANAIIEAEKFYARDAGTRCQRRRQVNRVERADRFRGKRLSRAINDVRAQSQQMPVRRRSIQMGAPIGRGGFLDLPKGHRADRTRSHSKSVRSEATTSSALLNTSQRAARHLPRAAMPERRSTPRRSSPNPTFRNVGFGEDYAESSAVLAWLLGEDAAPHVREVLSRAELVVASDLTLLECDRVLIRAVALGEIEESPRPIGAPI